MTDQSLGEVAKWVAEIALYDKEGESWFGRGKKIVKRYKDERGSRDAKSRFNILWSNVQTLSPALYATPPKANIDRRFQDDDDLGRIASQVLERAVGYFVNTEIFDSVMQQTVLDRLLPGRGTSWVRYVPNFKDDTVQGTDTVKEDGVDVTDDALSDVPSGYDEEVVPDYIHWQDFGHTYGRTWEEVTAVWKKVYMTRSALVKRFGDKGKTVPLDYSPEKINETKIDDGLKKATVYEIWDKTDKKAIWVHKDVAEPLDTLDDPLGLKDFFPSPKPIYATLANDSLYPVPDYVQYQDQAGELDQLTGRISSITKAIKVAGVYDGSAEGVQRLLAEGVENQLIAVDQWAVFAEKGGMKGVVDFLPMKEIAEVLLSLYDARERVKQIIYEITGISDIIRGASDPNETATAQEMKGKFATLRLDAQQKEVARISRDLVRIMTEIISKHFSMDTIKQISGVKLLTAQEKQAIQLQSTPAPTNPQPQPVPEDMQELMALPSWEDVEKLIRDDVARCFRIDIETDSTIKVDQEAEKKSRVEFITAAGGFIQQAAMIQDPQIRPLLMEMLMFGMRGFKIGREMETSFKTALDKMRKQAEQPQQPPPDPAAMAAQAQAQNDQQRLQLDAQQAQADNQLKAQELQANTQLEQQKMSNEAAKAQAEVQIKHAELQIKQAELEIKKADLALREQELHSNHTLKTQELHSRHEIEGKKIEAGAEAKKADKGINISMTKDGLNDHFADQDQKAQKQKQDDQQFNTQLMGQIVDAVNGLTAAVTKEKKVKRGADGRVTGVQ